jgi:hypothetical protein
MRKWVTAVAVVAAVAGVGLLVWWQWDPIWSFVFSPVGGFVAKILFTGKVLKVVAVAAFAAGAGWVAMRRKLRRGTPAVEQEHAPPVFGPPVEPPSAESPAVGSPAVGSPAVGSPAEVPSAQAPAAPPAAPYVAAAPEALTSGGTATATTTEPTTAPASRPI